MKDNNRKDNYFLWLFIALMWVISVMAFLQFARLLVMRGVI